jgi:hypothetical protein
MTQRTKNQFQQQLERENMNYIGCLKDLIVTQYEIVLSILLLSIKMKILYVSLQYNIGFNIIWPLFYTELIIIVAKYQSF